MPSGQTHDRLTWIGTPVVVLGVGWVSHLWPLGAIAGASYLVGGLFFSPDLDTYSRPYQRWGYLRWLWWPYQQWIPHRSVLSHGPIIGTMLRLLYGGSWLVIFLLGLAILQAIAGQLGILPWIPRFTPEFFHDQILRGLYLSLRDYPYHWLMVFVGLESAAMVHYLSDWGVSSCKRFKLKLVRGKPRHDRR